jgi:hypothetical protein
VKVAFYDALDAEYDYTWPFNQMKHRFIDFTKVVFKDVQMADYNLSAPFAYLKHYLNYFLKVDFSMTRMKKMISRGLQTT